MVAADIQAAAIIYGVIVFALLKIGHNLDDKHELLNLLIHFFVIFSFYVGGAWIVSLLGSAGMAMFSTIKWFTIIFALYVVYYFGYEVLKFKGILR